MSEKMSISEPTDSENIPTSSPKKTMDTFTFNLWVRVFRALTLVCVVGLTQYALIEFETSNLKASSCLTLLSLMSSIMIIPLGMLVDTKDTRLDKFIVYFEIINLGLLLPAAILAASQISRSHAVEQIKAISSYTRFSIKAAAAIAFLAFALTAILLIIGIHNIGAHANYQQRSCEDLEKVSDSEVFKSSESPPLPPTAATRSPPSVDNVLATSKAALPLFLSVPDRNRIPHGKVTTARPAPDAKNGQFDFTE